MYLSKVNKGNTRTVCEICWKLIMKTPERRQRRNFTYCSVISIVQHKLVNVSWVTFLQGGIKNFWINFSTVRGTSFSEPHCQLYFDQWPVNWNIIGNVNFFLIVRFIIWFLLCLWIWHLYVGVDIKRVSTEMNL